MTFRDVFRSRFALPLALVVGVVLTRALMLASPDLMVVPDDALLGLMALDRLHGGSPHAFFWGQNYGLAFFEIELAARAFAWFGTSDAVLKATMLVPFTIGLWFFAAWVRRVLGVRAAWIAAFLLLLCPPWFQWSMKARGGYVTAFCCVQIAIWAATSLRSSAIANALRLAVLFLCAGIVALAQTLWLLPLFACLVLVHSERTTRLRRVASIAVALAGAITLSWLVRSIASTDDPSYSPSLFAGADTQHAIASLPHRLFVFFTGRFLYGQEVRQSFASFAAAWVWLALGLGGIAFAIVSGRADAKGGGRMALASLAAIVAAATSVSEVMFGPRYFLPAAECVALLAARAFAPELMAIRHAFWVRIGAFLALAVGLVYAIDSRDPSQQSVLFDLSAAEHRSLDATIDDLHRAGVENAYVMHDMLTWTLMFESKGTIAARFFYVKSRRRDIALAVDAARVAGKRVALLGRVDVLLDPFRAFVELHGVDPKHVIVHDDRWYYVLDPDKKLLEAALFRLSQ